MSKPKLGFIGLGLMGHALTAHLIESGYTVTGYDIDEAKVSAAAKHGVTPAASSADVTQASDIVLMCVISTDAVEEAVFGTGGVAEGGSAGKVLVDHSTTIVSTTKDMAARLRAACGMGWVDAPVSGGPPAARRRIAGHHGRRRGCGHQNHQSRSWPTSPAASPTLGRRAPGKWPRWSTRFWC